MKTTDYTTYCLNSFVHYGYDNLEAFHFIADYFGDDSENASYVNDTCPSLYIKDSFQVWVNWKDEEQREIEGSSMIIVVPLMDEYEPDFDKVREFNDVNEAVEYLDYGYLSDITCSICDKDLHMQSNGLCAYCDSH